MFNNFNLTDAEVLKLIEDYKPLIIKSSILKNGLDEDLVQEIKLQIFKDLTKNREYMN